MEQLIANYHAASEQSEAMVQDYYAGKPPFCGHPACIPMVPTEEDGTPMLGTGEVQFEYIEINTPDGENRLAILTPWTVKNGPGPKWDAGEM